jgi:lipopolysaccharide/colanic/teichoic acid biosynthesis glycosyltransferase
LNILIGDMSIIGPRPQTQRCFEAFPKRLRSVIVQVRPGLSGIGSIVFRDEEDMLEAAGSAEQFYDDVIMPYKAELEDWYVNHQGLGVYVACIGLTIWSVLSKDTALSYRVFPSLPEPPPELAALKYGRRASSVASLGAD